MNQNDFTETECSPLNRRGKPRKLRLLTGPPLHPESDTAYAELVQNFDGKTVICGGTTATIISKQLRRPIEMDIKLVAQEDRLPPPSSIVGIDLVTEGILTLTDVVQRIEADDTSASDLPMASLRMVKLLRNSDEIELIVGTKVNAAHQDPNLPIDLDVRRNIVKRLKLVLESKYRKRVTIRFF